MKKSYFKRLSVEDKFGRKYNCCMANHPQGLAKHKRYNRKQARRKLKGEIMTRKEKIQTINKDAVNDNAVGGVECCPFYYSEMKLTVQEVCCDKHIDCKSCWNEEYIEKDD